ncbi:TspO/MBR family protein [Nonomuraea zeae]|uniref:Tryptophan-rich sensory protein n=1 Tax=Nonomuraea zeae TaxID=1642303 RepID=A0A5S4GZ85_9ACTN|nr:TspO/MBR family protein [Nonomuraea zeae]TMR38278.1 tryptophan-rich sensory protein [Nonomuraea zeae]
MTPAARPSFRRYLLKTATAVTAAAALGGLSTDANSAWYRTLRKPRWQPPSQAFGLVWTPLYGLIAYSGARALTEETEEDGRARLRRAFALNLALNAAWTPLFFAARAPRLALADIVALNASNVVLVRRFLRADRRAGLALLPYAAWTLFATALNVSIAVRNPNTRTPAIAAAARRRE